MFDGGYRACRTDQNTDSVYTEKRGKRLSCSYIQLLMKLLMDTGTGLTGDTVATVSPPRFCKQKRRMNLK